LISKSGRLNGEYSYETDVTNVGKNAASETFIPPHGGYAGLLAYRKALVVFQGTVRFCERFLETTAAR
jgi:hypothetical protein